jgi:hypothetical protein
MKRVGYADRGGDGEWGVSRIGRRRHLPGGWTLCLGFSGIVGAGVAASPS